MTACKVRYLSVAVALVGLFTGSRAEALDDTYFLLDDNGTRRTIRNGALIESCDGSGSDFQTAGMTVTPDGTILELSIDDGGSGALARILGWRVGSCNPVVQLEMTDRLLLGITIGSDGRPWVADNTSRQLLHIDHGTGSVIEALPLPPTQSDLSVEDVDRHGFFYVVGLGGSYLESVVRVLSPRGELLQQFVVSGGYLSALRVGSEGHLWGTTGSNALREFLPDGTALRQFEFLGAGLSFAADGRPVVGSTNENGASLKHIGPDGVPLDETEIPGDNSAFSGPFYIGALPTNFATTVRGSLYRSAKSVEFLTASLRIAMMPGGQWTAVIADDGPEAGDLASLFGEVHVFRGDFRYASGRSAVSAQTPDGDTLVLQRRSHEWRLGDGSIRVDLLKGWLSLRADGLLFVGRIRGFAVQ